MIKLESEFNFNEEVYIIKDSEIIKSRIRYVKFPDASRFNQKPKNETIQFGLCTDKELEMNGDIQETEQWYTWRFAREMGRTKNELLDKLKD